MGSAKVQGRLWGEAPHDWIENERLSTPVYQAVFDAVGVVAGMRLLDVGCGAGWAMELAAHRGATVAGLDASEGLLTLARDRLPGGDIRQGDLEKLPFDDESFDLVTSFNAAQYATDPVAALREMARVAADDAKVAVATWGNPEQCESREMMAALRGLLPPPPPGIGGPFAFSSPGKLEELCRAAGLTPQGAADVMTPFIFLDLPTAVRVNMSSGPARRTIEHAGEAATRAALIAALEGSLQTDGTYRQMNVFRYLVAKK